MFDPLPRVDFNPLAQSAKFVQFGKKKKDIYSSYPSQICYQSIRHTGAAMMMQVRDPDIRLIIGYLNRNFIVFPQVIQMIYAVLHTNLRHRVEGCFLWKS